MVILLIIIMTEKKKCFLTKRISIHQFLVKGLPTIYSTFRVLFATVPLNLCLSNHRFKDFLVFLSENWSISILVSLKN